MKQIQADHLMRRFIDNRCTAGEVTRFIKLMASEKHRQLYDNLMMETMGKGAIETVAVPDDLIEKNFIALERELGSGVQSIQTQQVFWLKYITTAAAIAGIVLAAALAIYHLAGNSAVQYATGFGEIRRIELPDGSTVVLNGNSAITYCQKPYFPGPRSVELRGEAFFRIRKTPDRKKFVVVMPGSGSIEVLGTEFNVRHRPVGSRVMLRTGSIRLTLNKGGEQPVIMTPGETIDISRNGPNILRKNIDPSMYDNWTTNKLVFDNTPLHEIADMLRDTYGLEVSVSDPRLLDKKLSGTAPIHNLDIFLEALSGSFDLRINRQKDKVIISAR